MSLIQLEIDDTLIQAIGLQAVKTFMERQLTLLRIQYLGEKIAAAIQQAGINHQQKVKEARQEAWQEYKTKYFQDTIGKQECPFCWLSSWRI
jgi:hypothetical protein